MNAFVAITDRDWFDFLATREVKKSGSPRPSARNQAVVLDAYGRQCAITAERAVHALDAAHIRAFADRPFHELNNGLLLRSDVHRLFDAGYITVTPAYRGRGEPTDAAGFQRWGELICGCTGPESVYRSPLSRRPSPEALIWHNENKFRP